MEGTFIRPRMDLSEMTPEKEEAPTKEILEEGEGTVWSSLKKTLVIITTTSVVLLAMRNTVTYHLQHFWGASGNFWQHQWDKILDLCGHDQFVLIVYGPVIVSYLVYWGVGSLFILVDLTSLHKFTKKYKMQPHTNEPLALREVLKTFVVVSFNQIFVGIPSLVPGYWIMQARGYDRSPQLPTFHWVLFELVTCIIAIEFGFYYAHRFNQCYGVLGILDHLHGTNKTFRASTNYARHHTFLTLTPPRKMFPDVDPDAKTIKGKSC